MGWKNGGTVPEGGLVRIWLVLHSPTYHPAISPGETFDLHSFNPHFEVPYVALLLPPARLER